MNVAVLIISHSAIGSAMQEAIKTTFDQQLPLTLTAVEIDPDTDPDSLLPKLEHLLFNIDHGDGVLILTDLYGSTPCNIARKLSQRTNTQIVTGLNLPMLLRVMNYPDLSLDELAEKAITGGQNGITSCEQKDD